MLCQKKSADAQERRENKKGGKEGGATCGGSRSGAMPRNKMTDGAFTVLCVYPVYKNSK